MTPFLYVGIFGLLGCLARYGVGRAALAAGWAAPSATLTVNLLGSLAIGFIAALSKAQPSLLLSPHLATGLMVGFLGGFTTFSAFSLELLVMTQGGRLTAALAYAVISPTLGLIAALVGYRLAGG